MENEFGVPYKDRQYCEEPHYSIRGVFERLHSDSFIRNQQREVSRCSSSSKLKPKISIEDLLRNKYSRKSEKSSAASSCAQTPRMNLEQALANSRFTNRSERKRENLNNKNDKLPSNEKIIPKQAEISLKELAKNIECEEAPYPTNRVLSSFFKQNIPSLKLNLSSHSQPVNENLNTSTVSTTNRTDRNKPMTIEQLREQVRARPKIFEHEEPPDLLDMDMLSRNEFWLRRKQDKIKKERENKEKNAMVECTFNPKIDRLRSNSSYSALPSARRSPSPHLSKMNSYSKQHFYKKNFRFNSNERPRRFSVKSENSISLEVNSQQLINKNFLEKCRPLSPKVQRIGYDAGFNTNSFLNRAQPMASYKLI
ncbi:unnamed protein product [Blepharisma stoltei]|uniref:Uncharacterized protein n=1 Tax=Blepharisma stoltei TaxID=1481888 RepID=A0AAU9ITS0_9CILI|nr:unnamed protein product [Blepharisma stoltei]